MQDAFTRNIETILPSKEELQEKLREKKSLRVKFGIDPTGPSIHLGRAVALWKLKELQDLGHTIILIFGDFTARIGDPSDKDKRRPALSKEQIESNVRNYIAQVGSILDMAKVELHYNSQWHEKMSEADLIKLARLLTVNQMLARRNFSQRIKEKKEIGIDEFLYPLLQGYDSYAIHCDVEMGGNDQLFNLKTGRTIQQALGQEPQLIIITKMLWGLDKRKMSTSWGNVVNITDAPDEMFGKLMSLDDALMGDYARLATGLSEGEINSIEKIKHPKAQKERIAYEIVKRYHGSDAAKRAKKEFEAVFSQKKLPSNLQEMPIPKGSYPPVDLLIKVGFASSKSEARRLIEQKGVRINGETLISEKNPINVADGTIIAKGKKDTVRISCYASIV